MIAHAQPLATPGHAVHAHSSLKTDCCRGLLSSSVVFSCSSRSLLSFSVSLAMSKRSSRSASVPPALPARSIHHHPRFRHHVVAWFHRSGQCLLTHCWLTCWHRHHQWFQILEFLRLSLGQWPPQVGIVCQPAPKRSLSFREDGMGSQPLTKHPRPAPVTQPSLDSILQSIRDTVQTEVTAALDAHFLLNSPHPISAGTCTCTVVITFLYMPVCACACITTVGWCIYLSWCGLCMYHVITLLTW